MLACGLFVCFVRAHVHRQLGFAAGVPVRTDTPDGGFGYGAYNAPVHLTNVSCTGAESRLTQCAANNRTTCAHM